MRLSRPSIALLALAALVSASLAQDTGVAPAARVRDVQSANAADLVVLEGGFDHGLRQGMICRIGRGGIEVADAVLVEVRPAHSTALLLGVTPGQSVRAGDLARVKTLKS
jgi:hypothetical protein